MALKDAQGLDITTDSDEAIAAINQFVQQSLTYGRDAEAAILTAIAADHTCAIANAYGAAHFLSLESAAARKQAEPYLEAAKQLSATATEREQLYIQAIASWAERAIDRAITLHRAIAHRFPQDLLSVQQGQYHCFYRGDTAGLLQIAETVLPANPHHPYLYSMIAFGLEQCHRLKEAEDIGRQATASDRHNPWAHHAVAHVMEMQGRTDEGIAWMESLSDTWEKCNSMLYTHNWWHVGLFYLAKADRQKVLSLYDTHIWGRARQSTPKDQVGAIALLARLELKGTNVGDRWQKLATHLLPRVHEHALPFQDLHYVYALARAGWFSQTHEMLLSMENYAHTLEPTQQNTWLKVTLPAAHGIVAHASKDWERAIAHLKPVLPHLWSVGGSHAQRHLFQQIYLHALHQAKKTHSTRLIRYAVSNAIG